MAQTIRDAKRGSSRRAAKQSKELRILVVENHTDTREGIYRFLQALGYHVTATESFAETLEIAAQSSFDILLSDLSLPDGTGWELLGHLTDRGQRPPHAIAMSGLGASEDRSRSKAAGFMLHLVKPFRPEKLEEVLRDIALGVRIIEKKPAAAMAGGVQKPGKLRQKLHDGLCQQLAGGALLQSALIQRLERLGEASIDMSHQPRETDLEDAAMMQANLREIVVEAKRVEKLFHGALDEVRELMQNLP